MTCLGYLCVQIYQTPKPTQKSCWCWNWERNAEHTSNVSRNAALYHEHSREFQSALSSSVLIRIVRILHFLSSRVEFLEGIRACEWWKSCYSRVNSREEPKKLVLCWWDLQFETTRCQASGWRQKELADETDKKFMQTSFLRNICSYRMQTSLTR